jgi:ribonuclease P protein component
VAELKDIWKKKIIIEQRSTFKKEEKLKSRKLIEVLFKQGTSFSIFPLRVLYFFSEENIAPLQTGFAVSGKHFKNAVDRNRVKRLMREAYRLQKNGLTANLGKNKKCMAVFFIYTTNEILQYKNVAEKMQSALNRLNKIVDETIVANT